MEALASTGRWEEELRGCFRSELEFSARVLQRFAALTNAIATSDLERSSGFGTNEVACLTNTLAGEPLRLPTLTPLENSSFLRVASWEETILLVGQDRELCFGREVDEKYKQAARPSIEFLVSEAKALGLSAKRIFTVVSTVWSYNELRAQGLLWVLEKEYPDIRWGPRREWANRRSEEFMIYTVLYLPPIVITTTQPAVSF